VKTAENNNHYKTILVITLGFLLLYFIFKWEWTLIAAFAAGIFGVISEKTGKMVQFIWDKLTTLLGFIVPTLLMTLIFYLVLFPVAIISRLFGQKDPLKLKNRYESLFTEYSRKIDKTFFTKPW